MTQTHLKMTETTIDSCQEVSELKKNNFQIKNKQLIFKNGLCIILKAT
jgi:hypothetical protein